MPEPAAPDVISSLEREVLDLRTAQADIERERAAIVLERAAIDAERALWIQERDQLVEQCRRLELERAASEQALAAAQEDRLAHERANAALQARLKHALRWSPRHWLGTLAHRSERFRRLRSGG